MGACNVQPTQTKTLNLTNYYHIARKFDEELNLKTANISGYTEYLTSVCPIDNHECYVQVHTKFYLVYTMVTGFSSFPIEIH